jgi:hypothetical protein
MFTNILSRLRTTRARAESEAYVLDDAARAATEERSRPGSWFDESIRATGITPELAASTPGSRLGVSGLRSLTRRLAHAARPLGVSA